MILETITARFSIFYAILLLNNLRCTFLAKYDLNPLVY